MKKKIVEMFKDYRVLLRSIPWWVTLMFVMSVVFMNLFANKVLFRYGEFLAADGGILLSWMPFLTMDVVVKRFGVKAANKLNIFGLVVNLLCVGAFAAIAAIPGDGGDYSSFNATFSSSWFIVLGSSLAFVVSGLANNVTNFGIGKLFKKKPDGRIAFIARSYVSTFIGQFVDNLIFAIVVYMIFGPMYWEGFVPFTWALCVGDSVVGAALELFMEVVFSPIGFAVCRKWSKNRVGQEYLNRQEMLRNECKEKIS
jgi:uncharacterized PurR-regulated membrane protein YhhQ (DUF165 family)